MSGIISFDNAGVNNQNGIDITQGMIDDVANPFLDLNAIVTQFKFVDSSVTITIPAGTTVKYGDEQCTLLEDAIATLTPSNLTGDSHATTTSGTVLSETALSNGQLITTSGQWTVALKGEVKVRTQDGCVILGSKDPNSFSDSSEVTLSEGTNVQIKTEENADTKEYETVSVSIVNNSSTQFYFLADVTYHQIVLQELYDTLESMEEELKRARLLQNLKNSISKGNSSELSRNKLSQEEYDAIKDLSLSEIIDYLFSTKIFNKDDIAACETVEELKAFLLSKGYIEPSEIISIYENYGVFSDNEIENLRDNKMPDKTSPTSGLDTENKWTVSGLLALAGENAFTDSEINTIYKSAAENFFDSLKSVSGITVNDINKALTDENGNKLCEISDEATITEAICEKLKNKVKDGKFDLNNFHTFLESLLNIKVPSSEICPLPACEVDEDKVKLTKEADSFFEQLNEFFGSLRNEISVEKYLLKHFKPCGSVDDLMGEVLAGKKTIQDIYKIFTDNTPEDYADKSNWTDVFKKAVTDPGNADSLNIDSYFKELKEYTEGTDPLITLDDLKATCKALKSGFQIIEEGKTVDDCIKNLRLAVSNEKTEVSNAVSKINSNLSEIVVTRWKKLKTQISAKEGIGKFIISNGSIFLEQLKEAIKATGVYDKSDIAGLKDKIESATSKTEIMEILSDDELKKHINVGSLITGLTKTSKCSSIASEYNQFLINKISEFGRLDNATLYSYQLITDVLNDDNDIQTPASEIIIKKLKEVKRIDSEGLKSGILNIARFTEEQVEKWQTDTKTIIDDELLKDYNEIGSELLNLCLLAGTPSSGQDNYTLASGVQRTLDSSGNYVYEIVKGDKIIASSLLDSSFSKRDATAGMALPYFALAIMYEKTCIQQMILVEQLKQIEKINDEIEENNRALKALTDLYDKVYSVVTWTSNGDELKGQDSLYANLSYRISLEGSEMSVEELHKYLISAVGSGTGLGKIGDVTKFADVNADSYTLVKEKDDNNQTVLYFRTVIARYDRDGNNMWSEYTKWQKGEKGSNVDHNTSNIDVKEQATLTHISNLQDQVRMYGDTLSTDAQLMTTKMEQYMQDANSCVSACTQTVKSIGDYWKNIITNIR